MTDLYIANTSKQHHDFYFRRPEAQQATFIPIKAAQQVKVMSNASSTDVDYILEHHRKYGIISADEAGKKRSAFVGLCYSVDKPVPEKVMRGIFESNDVVLKEQGKKNIEEQAAASTAKLNEDLAEKGLNAEVGHMEVEIREELKPGQEASTEPSLVEVAPKGEGRRGGKVKG